MYDMQHIPRSSRSPEIGPISRNVFCHDHRKTWDEYLPNYLMPKMTSSNGCLCFRQLSYKALYSKSILLILLTLLQFGTSASGVVLPGLDGSTSLYNTSSSSNALKEYVIYSFVEGASANDQNEEIRAHLGMMLAPVNVQEYGGDYTGVEFWHVKMNDMQRASFSSVNPKVSDLSW